MTYSLSVTLAILALFFTSAIPARADTWQVAGIVNLGEPSLRVVYDTSYTGSRARAMYVVNTFREAFSRYGQPGIIDGLMQVGYSDHIAGVQVQVYSNNPYLGDSLMNTSTITVSI